MGVELRAVTGEELDELARVDHAAFASVPADPDRIADVHKVVELDRTRAVFEGGRMVAASAAFSFELTLPGLATVPVAAVSLVGVLPTHRRRGHLTRMMGALLDDAAGRGEAVAVLLASESLIYGRFGYGVASSHAAVEIDTRHAALRPSTPADAGRVVLLGTEEAAKVLPPVLDAARRSQPGDLRRPQPWWDGTFRDPEGDRRGASPLFYAVHESSAGEADGYAAYRVRHTWEHGLPDGRVLASEVVGLTPEAEAALWRFLLSLDLVSVVEADLRPVDDPLRWMLADPRRLRVTMASDMLWARLLDVAAALAARRYRVPGTLVIDVADAFRPDAAGRYRLDGGPDGAECRRTTDDADLSLTAEELGALYLGGTAASTLAAAGRVVEHRPGALAEADAFLGGSPLPFCRTHF
ncbi:MAG: GNAT family N-acetyltransferase [Acidimicrobiia bacterium]